MGLPDCRRRLDGLRGRPERSRRGTRLERCLGSQPGPAGRVAGSAVAMGSRDGRAAGTGSHDDPEEGTARPGGHGAETVRPGGHGAGTGSRDDPETGTARPGGRGGLRASGVGGRKAAATTS